MTVKLAHAAIKNDKVHTSEGYVEIKDGIATVTDEMALFLLSNFPTEYREVKEEKPAASKPQQPQTQTGAASTGAATGSAATGTASTQGK